MSKEDQAGCKNAKQEKYRINNWLEYDRVLVKRGEVTVWLDEEFLRAGWLAAPSGKRGAPFIYSSAAIQALLVLKRCSG